MTPPTADHDHPGFDIPTGYTDPLNRPIDHHTLGRFAGAAFDGCTTCQDALLTLIVHDAPTTARLVELACVATQDMMGGLPPSMVGRGSAGLSSPEFRHLAEIGLDGDNDAMFTACEQMSVEQRRAAANTAADLLIGVLATVSSGSAPGERAV